MVRSLVGMLLMIGGVFGFLPVLGFWMFPLGVAFIALDIPLTAHRIDAWMVQLKEQAKGHKTPQARAQESEHASDKASDQDTDIEP